MSTATVTATVLNDLESAVEVEEGGCWHVLYPGQKVCLGKKQHEIVVRLRDASDVVGRCTSWSSLRISRDFQDLTALARQREERESREAQRLAGRKMEKHTQLNDAVERDALWAQTDTVYTLICFFVTIGVPFWALAFCVASAVWNWEDDTDDIDNLVLAVPGASTVALVSTCWLGFWCVMSVSSWKGKGARYAFGRQAACATCGIWFAWAIAMVSLLVMTVRWVALGYWWGALILWPGAVCCNARAVRACMVSTDEDSDWRRARQNAQRRILDRTIVFEGRVLEGREACICSWPGKYEEAWDTMVNASLGGEVSAAVVFLPEGTSHFGIHDRIPADEDLEGDCWCTPLYGERKPWGCRWWTRWIANIETAVELGQTLEVYFFQGMVGQGKVRSFETAGGEHWNRDELYKKKKDFENSDSFTVAVKAGLNGLSQKPGADGTSPYSREVQRLFLDWLPQDEAAALKASEGLGNSQKAEVAWLERKGYRYAERDVAVWLAADTGRVPFQAAAEPSSGAKPDWPKLAWGSIVPE